jgi:hypothetical protein
MIAEQHVNGAACTRCFVFEASQQLEGLERTGPAIDHIAELHEVCTAPAPSELGIDDAGCLQNIRESIVGPVDVSDCNDPIDATEVARQSRATFSGSHGHCEERSGDSVWKDETLHAGTNSGY